MDLGGGSVRVSGPDGTDTLTNVERLVFDDQTVPWPLGPGSISIGDATISEGNAGTKLANFTVTRSGGTAAFNVNFMTSNGTATTANGDYVAASGTLQFAANETTKTISVTINGDTVSEPDETFSVNLSGATNGATIGDGVGTGTITNDDTPPPGSVSIGDATISEGNAGTKLANFTVTRSGGTAAFNVNFATSNGTATTADGDYVAASGTLQFAANETTKAISVTINGDTVFEPDEIFSVNLSGATNGATIGDGVGTGTITNDDPLPPGSVSIGDATISEGNAGTKLANFTVTRSGGTAAFNVGFATSNGTATTADGDYVAASGTLQFAANETTKTISVTINGDTKVEPDENFFVNLSGPTNGATVSDGAGLGTIQDDGDQPPQPDLTASNVSLSDTTPDPGQVVGVNYQINNIGSGAAGGFDAGIYLSTNSVISTADTLLDFHSFASLSGNASASAFMTVTLPSWLTPGVTYYVGAVADDISQVTESNESNNASNPVTISMNLSSEPDLTVSNVSLSDTTLLPGQTVTVGYQIRNVGSVGAGGFFAGVYLSTNSIISTADTLLGAEFLNSLAGNSVTGSSLIVNMPALTPGATYYVGVIADDIGGVPESDESNNASAGVAVTATTSTGPVRNDFNGDGKTDVLLRNDNGRTNVWTMDGGRIAADSFVDATPLSRHIVTTGDFNGDHKSDVLLRNDNGRTNVWTMDGGGIAADSLVDATSLNWHIVDTADFNADGKTDVLLRNDNGRVNVWTMDGGRVAADSFVDATPLNWHIVDTADFNGDGKADVLLRNDNGRTNVWTMDGGRVAADSFVDATPLNWHIVDTADFNGDGKADVLLRNDNGRTNVWTMDGGRVVADSFVDATPLNWHIVDTADFNGDGKADVLLRNDNGRVNVWTMDGGRVVADSFVDATPLNWHIVDTADFNGDGKADVLLRNDTGRVNVWTMDGGRIVADSFVDATPLNWQFVEDHFDLV